MSEMRFSDMYLQDTQRLPGPLSNIESMIGIEGTVIISLYYLIIEMV